MNLVTEACKGRVFAFVNLSCPAQKAYGVNPAQRRH